MSCQGKSGTSVFEWSAAQCLTLFVSLGYRQSGLPECIYVCINAAAINDVGHETRATKGTLLRTNSLTLSILVTC